MNSQESSPIARLRHHVSGAIARGEAQPITEIPATPAPSAHTPGPWKTGGCGEDGWRLILGPTTRFFQAFGEAHTTGVAAVSVSDCEAEDLANARLIAAAPELLAELEKTEASLSAILASSVIDSTTSHFFELRRSRDAIRSAIAKAKGVAL